VTFGYDWAMVNATMRPVARSAHGDAIRVPSTDVAGRLQDAIGRDLVAMITGRTPRQVSRWIAGECAPARHEQQILRDALQIVQLLRGVEDDEVIRAWFMGMNPQLDDQAPAEVMAAGRARDVMAAARSFVDAG